MKIKVWNICIAFMLLIFGTNLSAQFEDLSTTEMLYHVSLVGAVENPGVYLVPPSTRVSEVLKMQKAQMLECPETEETRKSQIIPEPVNSERNIVLKRKQSEIKIDLAKYNILGDLNNNPYVQDGDIIYVHAKLGEIEITGAVKKEGFFEFLPGDRVADIIEFSLGLDHFADKEKAEIFRHNPNQGNERIIINLAEALQNPESPENIELKLDDRIYIRFVPKYDEKAQILIRGEVMYPGYYSINDGQTTLLEILEMCGGPTLNADLQNSFLQRRSKEDRLDSEFERLKNMLVEDMSELEYQYFKTKSREMQGKFSVDFFQLWNTKNEDLDILLKDKDYIEITRTSNIVQVSGQVKNPGLIKFVPGKEVNYYIEQAGGLSWNARKSKIQLIKARTGERLKPNENDIVEVQDMIFVPEKRDIDYWEITKDALMMISQIATTVLIIQNVQNN